MLTIVHDWLKKFLAYKNIPLGQFKSDSALAGDTYSSLACVSVSIQFPVYSLLYLSKKVTIMVKLWHLNLQYTIVQFIQFICFVSNM